MIKITLQKIDDACPCSDGWKTLLKSKGGKKKADRTVKFPLADVIKASGLDFTLRCLHCMPKHNRIWRKYAVWCARQVEHLMTDPSTKEALEVADRHADGMATDAELAAVRAAVKDARTVAARDVYDAVKDAAWCAVWAATDSNAGRGAAFAARAASRTASRYAYAARDAVKVAAWDDMTAWEAAMDAGMVAAWDVEHVQERKLIDVLTAGEWK
jgi:hypothetical protein